MELVLGFLVVVIVGLLVLGIQISPFFCEDLCDITKLDSRVLFVHIFPMVIEVPEHGIHWLYWSGRYLLDVLEVLNVLVAATVEEH